MRGENVKKLKLKTKLCSEKFIFKMNFNIKFIYLHNFPSMLAYMAEKIK